MLEWVWVKGHDPAGDRFVTTYFPSTRLPVQITAEIEIEESLGRNLIGLLVAEWKQADGDLLGAVDIVEQLEPTSATALSLAELYLGSGRYGDLVELTDGLANVDDVTALLIVYRGVAFREIGHHETARLAFKEALRMRSRSNEVRFRALTERALSYHAEGKLALARKDIDRIRAEDASYPGLSEALTVLGLNNVIADVVGSTDDDLSVVDPLLARAFQPLMAQQGPPPGWHADPTARHQHRYWDGTRWSEHVSNNGVTSIDTIA
jgi:tetratricopeptide (TPR) repeat protein